MENRDKNVFTRKVIVLLLAIATMLSSFPMQAFASTSWNEGTKVYFNEGGYLKGSDTNSKGNHYFYNSSQKYTNRWPNSSGSSWLKENCYALTTARHSYIVKPTDGGLGREAYCLEQNVQNPSSGNTKYTAEKWQKSPFVGNLYSESVQRGIMLALLYGKQPDSDTSDIQKLFGVTGANKDDWYMATQTIIWEYQQGLRTSASGGTKSYGITSPDFFYSSIRGRKAGEIYKAMLKKMAKHELVPSFTKWKKSNVTGSIKMTFDDIDKIWRSEVLTDGNNVGADLRIMTSTNEENKKENDKIKIVRQGSTNKYVLETTLSPDKWDNIIIRGKKDVPQVNRYDLLTWNANDGSHYQTLATGADDPVDFYFKMSQSKEIQAGEPGEPKLPSFELDAEKVDINPGFDQSSGTSHTGMGDAALDSEISLYVDGNLVESKRLSVNGYTDSPFYFTPWEDISQLDKTEVPTYDKDGNLLYTDYYWRGAKTVKTAETALPDGRFSENESGTGSGSRDHGAINYYAHCRDDGPMDYNITYENGTLTDESEISEDNPQPMKDDKGSTAYVNDNYRGKLQIVKTKDDQNPFTDKENSDNGVKDYSKASKWTVMLKSGGYEDCPYIRVVKVNPGEAGYDEFASTYRVTRDNSGLPADNENLLTVSKNGQIKILDLPYGTYEVKEISADAYGYVLESYEVNINTDNQLISKEINNKAKTNVIKVVKTNSETGKTVRWDADRTAFRIRYKGNPDLVNPEDAENYNRYLPNGSSYKDKNKNYVFYANKNGQIVLPYEIEYGIYQIEELTVPEGYYVGKYDDSGKGTIASMGTVDGKGNAINVPKTFADTVQVRDSKGNRVENFTGDVKSVYNTYTFPVTEQDAHVDGDDYVTYYAVVNLANNPAKGKIEITKNGEGLAGWNNSSDGGYSIFKAIWDKIRLKDSKFEIYSAEDIMQSDGVVSVKAFDAESNEEISLDKVSRDHAKVQGAKAIWQKLLKTGELIKKISLKDKSSTNITSTQYLIKAQKGAGYSESFVVKEDEMTYKYTLEVGMNYSKGGFNYTDVHVKKETISDDYVPEIKVNKPVLKSGELEVGFATMNYNGGNRITMNPLESEKNLENYTGVIDGYDKASATVIKPVTETIKVPDESAEADEEGNLPFKEEKSVVNAPQVPEGYAKLGDGWVANSDAISFMISKESEGVISYMIYVRDGENRWVSCDKDGNFYKSYTQEWSFTMAQHYKSEDGFTFDFDGIKISAKADHENDESVTEIKGFENVTPQITESAVFSHTLNANTVTFTGKPMDKAPIYFLTNDGIKTEMMLSGGLSHTKITVSQSQLFKFKKTYPLVEFFDGDEYVPIDWNEEMSPDNNYFEWVKDENNYVKAERHEVSKDNKEVYYTIDIVSNAVDKDKGFKVTYPDTTTCIPTVAENGSEGQLIFESVDDTMIYPIGSPVEIISTGLDGIATSSNLPLGEYYVREIASGVGHVNKGEWKKFDLSYADQYTPLVWDKATFDNEAVRVKVDLEKLFETAYESDQYTYGSGAVFGIYTAEEIKAGTNTEKKTDKKSVPADTLVGKMAVSDGHASANIKLPLGKYYVKEISAPTGYKTNNTKYYFDAVDILTADELTFEYEDAGINGFITQDGNKGLTLDFDVLYRYEAAKVNIDGKDYVMDQSCDNENVSVTVLDGRTNVKVKLSDGQSTLVKYENGGAITLKAEGQNYTAECLGAVKPAISVGTQESENFTKTEEADKTIIKYTPKVTKTNWLSEVEYKYVEPKEEMTDEEKAKLTTLELVSPEKTSKVKAAISYDNSTAKLSFDGTATKVTVDGKAIEDKESVLLERIQTDKDKKNAKATKAIINFDDGVTFVAEFDKAGNFYMSASGEADKNLNDECKLTVDGKEEFLKNITLKNTSAKTYARNNTSTGVLNITINNVKNNRLPNTPTTPTTPVVPDKPYISTTATDSETKDHISKADGKVTIIDQVSYHNLTAGKEYVITGILMDIETGNPILVGGKEVTASKTFTPKESSGIVQVEFNFDGRMLDGKSVVVFETVKADGIDIATHADIKDEAQTVSFPNIGTKAAKIDRGIVDTVKYENLIVGKEYTVTGILMDKETQKPLIIDGNKVTGIRTFTAEERSGTVDVRFDFDETKLNGKTVVVFEEVKMGNVLIGEHKDINDKGQTVEYPSVEIPKAPSTPKVPSKATDVPPQTGDNSSGLLWILLAGASLVICYRVIEAKKGIKKRDKEE